VQRESHAGQNDGDHQMWSVGCDWDCIEAVRSCDGIDVKRSASAATNPQQRSHRTKAITRSGPLDALNINIIIFWLVK
jgi:hypothetical protein